MMDDIESTYAMFCLVRSLLALARLDLLDLRVEIGHDLAVTLRTKWLSACVHAHRCGRGATARKQQRDAIGVSRHARQHCARLPWRASHATRDDAMRNLLRAFA
jgi:hypothetical protein